MSKYLIGVAVLIAIATVFFLFYKPVAAPVPNYTYSQIYKTKSKTFFCREMSGTESDCKLFVGDIAGKNLKDLSIDVDYGDFSKKILPSPDGKNLLITLEDKAIVLDTTAIAQKIILQAPVGDTLGTYDAFPAFIPYAKWLNDIQVQISIFKKDTQEPYGNDPAITPLEIKTITVNWGRKVFGGFLNSIVPADICYTFR